MRGRRSCWDEGTGCGAWRDEIDIGIYPSRKSSPHTYPHHPPMPGRPPPDDAATPKRHAAARAPYRAPSTVTSSFKSNTAADPIWIIFFRRHPANDGKVWQEAIEPSANKTAGADTT